jgi:hypothetical protein
MCKASAAAGKIHLAIDSWSMSSCLEHPVRVDGLGNRHLVLNRVARDVGIAATVPKIDLSLHGDARLVRVVGSPRLAEIVSASSTGP